MFKQQYERMKINSPSGLSTKECVKKNFDQKLIKSGHT